MGNQNSRSEGQPSNRTAFQQSSQQDQQSQRSPQPGDNQANQRSGALQSGSAQRNQRGSQQHQGGDSNRNTQQGGSDEPEPYNEPDLKEQDEKDPSGIAGRNGN